MAADLDRLTGFIEAERPHTGRAENKALPEPKKKKRLAELAFIRGYGTKATYSYSAARPSC
jgi:phosphoserine phosphatase